MEQLVGPLTAGLVQIVLIDLLDQRALVALPQGHLLVLLVQGAGPHSGHTAEIADHRGLEGLAAGAGLTPMEEDTFYQRVNGVLSYPHGEHLRVSYRPYYGLSGYEEVADTVYTLVLSQPATQGERGIWCVDRWMDQNGTRYLVVPETDQPMDDYYAALQDACDAGERPDLLDPVAVALDFEEDWSGRDLSPDAFVLEGASDLSEIFDLPLATVELENGVGG